MELIENVVNVINNITRDKILLIILPLAGVFFTVYLGFPQVKRFPAAFKQTFGGLFDKKENARRKAAGEVSPFQALAVAVAAQVGTGNIAGVATAIMLGGPGAIFWMWITAFFGMGTIFAEAMLSQKYREKDKEGEVVGGPAYYIKNGIKNKSVGKFLATFFSITIILALGFAGNMVQSNSVVATMNEAFGLPKIVIGITLTVLAGMVFIGGIGRIASFAEKIVPIMAVIYLGLSIFTMFKFSDQIIPAIKMIFSEAFSTNAIVGGAAGMAIKKAMQNGVSKGLFSNEAGMGSTPHAHAIAKVNHPLEQGLTAMVGVFISTTIICTSTAMVVLVTKSNMLGLNGTLVTQKAFEIAFGNFGKIALTIFVACFAFTTIIGWYYFGESNVKFLLGEKYLAPYRLIVLFFVFSGSLISADLVWNIAEMFNSIMVIPNIIALILLAKQVKELAKDYDKCEKLGKIEYNYKYENIRTN